MPTFNAAADIARYTLSLNRLADALGFPHDEDPIAIFDVAADRLRHGDLVTGEEAADLPDGSVVIRVHPDTHQPFPLHGIPGAAPVRVGETGSSISLGDDTIIYRVLYRAPYTESSGPAVGDVILGEVVNLLPAGTRYVQADEEGDPAEYGVVFAARDGYLPAVIDPTERYVIVTGPES